MTDKAMGIYSIIFPKKCQFTDNKGTNSVESHDRQHSKEIWHVKKKSCPWASIGCKLLHLKI